MVKSMTANNKNENNYERWGIARVTPLSECGKYFAKCIQNEVFLVTAKVFREGHDAIGATVVIKSSVGIYKKFHMQSTGYPGDDDWKAIVQAPSEVGISEFWIEGWSDPFKTWHHNAHLKVAVNQDIELIFEEGARVLEKWILNADLTKKQIVYLGKIIEQLRNKKLTPDNRIALVDDNQIWDIYKNSPLREFISKGDVYKLNVQRKLSSFCAWYQFFPRSIGAKVIKSTGEIQSGTFTTSALMLPDVKAMGFDVIYIPPIHPIGKLFRKGKNNSLIAKENDPGSPWAVGNKLGGHDCINPDLGTLQTFKNFIKTAKSNSLEVAIDLALQCSPDHPWVKTNPEWFTVRADGTIAYAENPPKKYQDIYPLNFDKDPEGIYNEILRIVKFWCEIGVTVIRVDNPHTKPIWLWERLISDIKLEFPDVIWLAEAFTLPAMMRRLGEIGYDQSHSYFLWRNNKHELESFFSQISGDDGFWYRASLWPTTPDNLTDYLAEGGVAAHAIRAVLAAMGSTTWGIYSGYELVEHKQRLNEDGTHALEHENSEKYEIKIRDWSKVEKYGIKQLITKLNSIRNNHFACSNLHSLQIHTSENDNIIAFSRFIEGRFTVDGKSDLIIVVVNLDPHNAQKGMVHLDWGALQLPEYFNAKEELSGKTYRLTRSFFVDLAPVVDVAHIFSVGY